MPPDRPRDDSQKRGCVLVQIDALPRDVLAAAIEKRKMPFTASLMRGRGFGVAPIRPGIPCTTPSFQAALFYGTRGDIPGFRWLDRKTGETTWFLQMDDATRIEEEQLSHLPGLMAGGSVWLTIFTGGADHTSFTTSAVRPGRAPSRLRNMWILFSSTVTGFLRLLRRTLVEWSLESLDAVRSYLRRDPWRGRTQFFIRAMANVVANNMASLGVREAIRDGEPRIAINYLGYDKACHLRGRSHPYAIWTLRQIDREIRKIHRAIRRSKKREYDIYLFSDHGVVASLPLKQIEGVGLEGYLNGEEPKPWKGLRTREQSGIEWRGVIELLGDMVLYLPALAMRILGGVGKRIAVMAGRTLPGETRRRETGATVRPTGGLAHVYLAGTEAPLTIDEIEERDPELVARLRDCPYVAHSFARTKQDGSLWWMPKGRDGREVAQGQSPPDMTAWETSEIRRMLAMEHAGDFVCLAARHGSGPVYNFLDEYAAHGGLEPEEQDAFLIHPPGCAPDGPSPEAFHRMLAGLYG